MAGDLKISQFDDGGLVQVGDDIAAVRAGADVKVSVGSAATKDIGSGPGDVSLNSAFGSAAFLTGGAAVGNALVVVLVGGGPGLPALNASNLTNVPAPTGLYKLKTTTADTTPGFLDDKIKVDNSLVKSTENPAANEDLLLGIRKLFASNVSMSSGTFTANITNGDYLQITATGIITVAGSMANGQAVIVRGIGFQTYAPIFSGITWGSAGTPVWVGKDDFVIYRDGAGNYIAAPIVLGIP